ncbi:MAG TPA: hypothetical protein VFQ61_18320, partial [Polyangiaceae bacterium]|nr:hypothetical protein [Polyangiaceae bacterium]
PLPHARSNGALYWLIFRKGTTIGELPLSPREVRLFESLPAAPLGQALAAIEATCPEQDRANLPAWLQHWLGRSMELEMWTTVKLE